MRIESQEKYALFNRVNLNIMEAGVQGTVLMEVYPDAFNSLKEAEDFLNDPDNGFINVPVLILKVNAFYKTTQQIP